MRRRDDEAARETSDELCGLTDGTSFLRFSPSLPHVAPKSIAFRSARSRYYCYDRVRSLSLRNVDWRSAARPFCTSALILISPIVYTETRERGRRKRTQRRERSFRRRALRRTCRRAVDFPDLSAEAECKLVKNGTDGKRTARATPLSPPTWNPSLRP